MRRRCIYGLLQHGLDVLPGFLLAGLAKTHLQGNIQELIWTSGAVALFLAALSSPPPAGRNHTDLLLCELGKGGPQGFVAQSFPRITNHHT